MTVEHNESAYTPGTCPKCGDELGTEGQILSSGWYNREVYCPNPECDFKGGVERFDYEEVGEGDDYCEDCEEFFEKVGMSDEDYPDAIYVDEKCPSCGKSRSVELKLTFTEFDEGDQLCYWTC